MTVIESIKVANILSKCLGLFSIEKYDDSPASLLPPTKANWTIGTIKNSFPHVNFLIQQLNTGFFELTTETTTTTTTSSISYQE